MSTTSYRDFVVENSKRKGLIINNMVRSGNKEEYGTVVSQISFVKAPKK